MKKYFLFFFFTVSLMSKAQQWQWANQTYGGLADGTQISADPNNNVFFLIRGSSLGPITYGSQTGVAEALLAKHDPQGNVLWTYPLNSAPAFAISSDQYGDVYVCGKAWNGAVLHSASGTDTIYTGGRTFDAYLAKYDPYGNLLWTRSWGDSISNDCHLTLKSDTQGNCYISGYSNYTSYSPWTHECGKFYVCKYDRNGNMLWVDRTAWENHAEPVSADLDENGNYYVTGNIYQNVTIGTTTLNVNPSNYTIFLAKYDKNGKLVWAKTDGTNYDEVHGISLDRKGHFYLNGFQANPSTFGTTTLTGTAPGGMFIVKYDTSSNVIWAKREGVKFGQGIACDSSGVFVTGVIQPPANNSSAPATGTLGIGPNTIYLNSAKRGDFFTAKYDNTGILKWAVLPIDNGGCCNWSYHISSDKKGNCFITGRFDGSMTLGATALTSYTNGLNYDAFIVKIKDSLAPIVTSVKNNLQKSEGLQVFPNPTGSSVNVLFNTSEECSAIDLYLNDVLGQRLYTKNCKGSRELSEVIDVSHYPKGVYFVELLTPKTREVRKIVVE